MAISSIQIILATPYAQSHWCETASNKQHSGIRFRSCIPVICENEVGVQQTRQPDKYYRMLNRVLRVVRLWPLDREVAMTYAELYLRARKAGRALSYVDLVLAALAKLNNVTLLTTDQDFAPFTDIRTTNWLATS
jgi:predicted nucleic acid-binding protein